VVLVALATLGLPPVTARADFILSNNLTAANGGTEAATGDTWLTAGFATDGSSYSLTSVTLLLARASIGGTAEVDIYDDGGLEPGSLVGTLTSPGTYSSTLSATTFGASGITLAGNSTYWVVLKATTGEFDWGWASNTGGSGVGFQHTWGSSDDAGVTWFTYDSYPTQMSVSVAAPGAVPEPGSIALLGLGLAAPVGYRLIRHRGRG
jgi:hypothetical protein